MNQPDSINESCPAFSLSLSPASTGREVELSLPVIKITDGDTATFDGKYVRTVGLGHAAVHVSVHIFFVDIFHKYTHIEIILVV